MNDDDIQAKIDAAVAAATVGLHAKNKELLGKLAARKAGDGEPDRLEAEVDKLAAELGAAGRALKDTAKERDALKASLDVEAGFSRKLLVEGGLSEALLRANVAAPFLPAVKAMLASQVQVHIDGDSRRAVIGDQELGAFVAAWAESNEGKHYVQAPANGGSGAGGGTGSNGVRTISRDVYRTLPAIEAAKFFAEGGKLTEG